MGKRKKNNTEEKQENQTKARNIKNVYIDKISNLIRQSKERLTD